MYGFIVSIITTDISVTFVAQMKRSEIGLKNVLHY